MDRLFVCGVVGCHSRCHPTERVSHRAELTTHILQSTDKLDSSVVFLGSRGTTRSLLGSTAREAERLSLNLILLIADHLLSSLLGFLDFLGGDLLGLIKNFLTLILLFLNLLIDYLGLMCLERSLLGDQMGLSLFLGRLFLKFSGLNFLLESGSMLGHVRLRLDSILLRLRITSLLLGDIVSSRCGLRGRSSCGGCSLSGLRCLFNIFSCLVSRLCCSICRSLLRGALSLGSLTLCLGLGLLGIGLSFFLLFLLVSFLLEGILLVLNSSFLGLNFLRGRRF